jgi:hypothetical protein
MYEYVYANIYIQNLFSCRLLSRIQAININTNLSPSLISESAVFSFAMKTKYKG